MGKKQRKHIRKMHLPRSWKKSRVGWAIAVNTFSSKDSEDGEDTDTQQAPKLAPKAAERKSLKRSHEDTDSDRLKSEDGSGEEELKEETDSDEDWHQKKHQSRKKRKCEGASSARGALPKRRLKRKTLQRGSLWVSATQEEETHMRKMRPRRF